jgi:hypothetical protein
MKKLIAGAVLGLLGIGVPSAVFAGEVNGNGDPTPIKTRHVAASICAFNGLDDGSESDQAVTPGDVQSFGSLVAGLARASGGAGSFAHMIHDEGPGTNCRGNLEGEPEG